MNIELLKKLAERFGITFGIMFGVIFTLHVFILLILSFIQMESLVVSGLDVTSMTWYGRVVVVFFYLIVPMVLAGWRTLLSHEFHELTGDDADNKETESAPEQDSATTD